MQELIRDYSSGILYRQWRAEKPAAVFLLVHGLGGQSSRWDFLAEFMLGHDFSSYAIELEGFGQTTTPKGHIDSFGTYYKDILYLYQIAAQENPDKKVFLIGESMGALIAFLLAAKNPLVFNALVCISPAFKSKLKFSPLEYLGIFSALVYNPKKQFFVHFDSSMCTRDEEYRKIMDPNPHEHRIASSRLLWNTLMAQLEACFISGNLSCPALFLLAGKDLMVDSVSAQDMFESLHFKHKRCIIYPDMLHALSIDLGREQVFADILSWIRQIV